MRKRGLIGTIIAAILVIALAVILAATYFTLKNFVVVDWQLFPRHREVLDLRDQAITPEEFDILAWQMPDTEILWSVPFQGSYLANDVQELTVTQLSSADVPVLAYLPNLKTVHAEQCTDYPQLLEAFQRYPKIEISYLVPVEGQMIAADTRAISVTDLTEEDAVMLNYLPKLSAIDGTSCRNYELLDRLSYEHPQWRISTLDSIAGEVIHTDATHLELEGAEYDELFVGLAAMPDLKSLLVRYPAADGKSLMQLREEYPDVDIHWEMEIFGNTYRDDVEELDISGRAIESIEQAKEIASKFPNLQKLIVESGSVANEDMAAFRDEVREDYKVVWTVYFTDKCKARTDETYFMPIKQGEYYFQEKHVENLRYCEDMVCIDIGHSTVATIDFVKYMPHLKYLILAWTQVKDAGPLEYCKELVYLEVDHGIIRDFTPLQGCTALEDLNINDTYAKVDPLMEMTWLKNLWVPERSYSDKQKLLEALPDTNVVTVEVSSSTGMGWRNLQNYYDMRDYLGMHYMA